MSHPFEHPSAEGLLSRVAQVFAGQVFLVADRQFLFVCGGPVGPDRTSLRKKFIQAATAQLQGFRVFLAETAAKDVTHHADPRFLNIADFERLLADVADCVLIFPETEGSLAELGFFAALEPIRRKCLVVNHLAFQGKDSFINNGPLALFDSQDSILRPTIHIDLKVAAPAFDIVCERIRHRLSASHRRKRIDPRGFDKLESKAKLAVIEELVYRFKILDIESLLFVLRTVFKSNITQDNVRELISVLISSKYVSRTQEGSDFFSPSSEKYRLLSIDGVDTEGLSVAVVDFYQRYAPQVYDILSEPAHAY
jgi:hypothetical protein